MRWLLVATVVALSALFAPRDAVAAEAVPEPEAGASAAADPLQQREDWIAVAGIVCYVVLPAIVTVVALVLFARFVARDVYGLGAASVGAGGSAAFARAASGRLAPRPPGAVLFRF